jgi:Flp pilus assembly pilin Flp
VARLVRRVRPQTGQAAVEYLLCAGLVAAALLLPVIEGHSAAGLLAKRLSEWFQGFSALLALS